MTPPTAIGWHSPFAVLLAELETAETHDQTRATALTELRHSQYAELAALAAQLGPLAAGLPQAGTAAPVTQLTTVLAECATAQALSAQYEQAWQAAQQDTARLQGELNSALRHWDTDKQALRETQAMVQQLTGELQTAAGLKNDVLRLTSELQTAQTRLSETQTALQTAHTAHSDLQAQVTQWQGQAQAATTRFAELQTAQLAAASGAEVLRTVQKERDEAAQTVIGLREELARLQQIPASPPPHPVTSGASPTSSIAATGEVPSSLPFGAKGEVAGDFETPAGFPPGEKTSPTAPTPVLTLRISLGDTPPRQVELKPGRYTIGRLENPETQIVLGEPDISRRHATLVFSEAGVVEVTDENSANGTFVGHSRLEAGHPIRLYSDEAVLYFGGPTCKMEWEITGVAPVMPNPAAEDLNAAVAWPDDEATDEEPTMPETEAVSPYPNAPTLVEVSPLLQPQWRHTLTEVYMAA